MSYPSERRSWMSEMENNIKPMNINNVVTPGKTFLFKIISSYLSQFNAFSSNSNF